jgi:hypothetical protein
MPTEGEMHCFDKSKWKIAQKRDNTPYTVGKNGHIKISKLLEGKELRILYYDPSEGAK